MTATDSDAAALRRIVAAARPCVQGLAPYVPGARPSTVDEQVCRLASNENPLGPSPKALAALAEPANLSRYPDNDGHALREVLSARHDCPADCLLFGNGSSDLLDLVACAYLEAGRSAAFARHAFVVYPLVVQAAGAEARISAPHPAEHEQPLGHDPETLRERVSETTAVVFIANPNNPTGTVLTDDEIRTLIEALPPQVLVVLDEAYAEYRDPIPAAGRFLEYPQVIVTRTFSKIFGLAGLRIGYALAHPEVVAMLNRVRQPFNVNTLAQQAAVAAVGDEEHVAHSRAANAEGMQRLLEAAHGLQLRPLGTHANFLTLDFGDQAQAVVAYLRERGILVRALPEYELPDWLRFTIGTPDETRILIDALHAWRQS